MVYLEDLPDELLLFIYRYLYSIDILCAFTGLNKRIEQTLLEYKQHIDLRYISLEQFCFFTENLLPAIKDCVVSLVVDDEWTDGIPLWYAGVLPELQKLSIVSFCNANLNAFLDLVTLPKLENLHVGKEGIPLMVDDKSEPSRFLYQIHSFKRVDLDGFSISFPDGVYGVKNSIEHLTITVFEISSLFIVLRYSPCLRYLKASAADDDYYRDITDIHLSNLREFHLAITDDGDFSWQTVVTVMQCLPSTLERFSFQGGAGWESDWLNGNTWAQTIPSHVQSFQLILKSYYNDHFNPGMSPEEMKQSWSTPFWIHEKHCYMQCFDFRLPQQHYLLCTDDCSDFDSFDNLMVEAKQLFYVNMNDSTDLVLESVRELNLNDSASKTHMLSDRMNRRMSVIKQLFFQALHILPNPHLISTFSHTFQHIRHWNLYSCKNDDFMQFISSFSRLTSLSICTLDAANLLLNCERRFNFIKILRIEIQDLDIDQIELCHLLHIFPHLYGFHIGFLLFTQFERLINEKLAGVMPTSLKITFCLKDLKKIQKEENEINDDTDAADNHEPDPKVVRDALAQDVVVWFKNYTFLGTVPEHKWTATYYADKREFCPKNDHLVLWQ